MTDNLDIVAPNITVIIPCERWNDNLPVAIQSLALTRQGNMEVIIVHSEGHDIDLNALPSAGHHVLAMPIPSYSEPSAKNSGIRAAKGKYILLLANDATRIDQTLSDQFEFLESHPGVGAVYGRVVAPERHQDDMTAPSPLPSGWLYAHLLLHPPFDSSGALIRRSLFADLGLFNETLSIFHEDEFWIRVSRFTLIAALDQTAAIRHYAVASRMDATNELGPILKAALMRWGNKNVDGACAGESGVKRRIARSEYEFGKQQLLKGNLRHAQQAFSMAFQGGYQRLRSALYFIRALTLPSRG